MFISQDTNVIPIYNGYGLVNGMRSTIIHVDMDAFYAAVEIRDNPELAGQPLIIGALPDERGVVSTCSYEARTYGVRSAMSIKEAYRRCPHGIYMHPNPRKYKEASDQIHGIWCTYTDLIEYISLDEGFLDVTGSAYFFGGAKNIGLEIKRRTKDETGLTCSVGIGYSLMSAKLASEEKKPDGFFEIPDPESLKRLIIDRDVRIIYGVGAKTAAELHRVGIRTVGDIYRDRQSVIRLLGNHGRQIVALADGEDLREVVPYSEPKSMGKEQTFQKDTLDFSFLKDILLLIAEELSYDLHLSGYYAQTVTLKITYGNMKKISRSKTGEAVNGADDIYRTAAELLDKIEKRPIRLAGISVGGLTKTAAYQMMIMDDGKGEQKEKLNDMMFMLQKKYGREIIKTGSVLGAQKRLEKSHEPY